MALLVASCQISRDGSGRATDNAFVEQLWRSVKWEGIYLNPVEDGTRLYQQLNAYFAYYKHHRPHQVVKGKHRRPSTPKRLASTPNPFA